MFLLLSIFLLLISFSCFWESKKERKGLRVTLSITLALMLSMLMEGAAHSLVEAQVMEGPLLITLYFVLPIVSFAIFQVLFYDIRMMDKEK
ncbi:hypothetical protein GCM10011351_32180 [Paraliobacillus quinghaiensis]|uniref:Uncharacterized protein n=1 Tax=Paraliobacillus quinghaiensis TaxID=470815 RepID=A0A917TYC4_9BACI|nr:hypothetical protein [Paraliobacillus quinghaiensis]GGM43757.1 hypothetical protein GCM10011351_32180 [Paraliobacillus quinghaiensis]